MVRALRYLLRKFYLLLAVCVIVLAVLVQLGRTFSYLVADYRLEISHYLSIKTQGQVTLEHVAAEWEGMQPVLNVGGILIASESGEPIVALKRARLRLDILGSLLHQTLVLGNLTLAGVDLELRQDAQGRWSLAGRGTDTVPVSDNAYQRLLDMLLAAKRITFEEAQLVTRFDNGQIYTFNAPLLSLENHRDFHRLQLQLGSGDTPDAVLVIAEGYGDPRTRDFSLEAYLQLHKVPADTPIAAVGALLAGSTERSQVTLHGGELNTSLWISRHKGESAYSVAGDLEMGAFTAIDNGVEIAHVDGFTADLAGRFDRPGQWQLGFQNGRLWNDDVILDAWNLSLVSARDDALQIQLDTMSLPSLTDFIHTSGMLDSHDRLTGLLSDLHPAGVLRNVWFRLPLADAGRWSVAANLEDVAVGSWNQVPAFAGVNGYVYSTAEAGYVQLDSTSGFAMAVTKVYDQPLQFDTARGQVAWSLRPDINRIYVNSGRLRVTDQQEIAEGFFWLSLPWEHNSGDIDLTIQLGAQDVSAMQYRKYVPTLLPDSLTQWLTRSLGGDNPGKATSGGFIFRGALNADGHDAHSFQLALDVESAELDYHPDWPALKQITGSLLLDDTDVYGKLNSGRLYNSDVRDARVRVFDNPDDDGKLLTVTGDLSGIASDGLRILRQSMLRRYIGDTMDSWYMHGSLMANVNLAVPLDEGAAGAHQSLVFDIDASTFALDNFKLALNDFSGRITYSSVDGIHSENLQGHFLGEPADFVLSAREESSGRATFLDATATLPVAAVDDWSGYPLADYITGELPLSLHLEIRHGDGSENLLDDQLVAAVSTTAILDQVAIDLPAPLGKTAGEPNSLVINYILGSDTALADVHYGRDMRALLHFDREPGALLGAVIGNGRDLELPATNVIAIRGALPSIDVSAWQDVYTGYQQQAAIQVQGKKSRSLPVELDVSLAQQSVGPMVFNDLRIQGRELDNTWDFVFTGKEAAGEIFWPLDKTSEAKLTLEYLLLPESLLGQNEDKKESPGVEEPAATPGMQLPPGIKEHLRPAQVMIKSLALGDADYGRWQFRLLPAGDQLALVDIEGSLRGLKIGGTDDVPGASLRWQTDPEAPYTEISARIEAGNFADVMTAWSLPQSMESEKAVFDVNLRWDGSPDSFALEAITGPVASRITDGRFLRSGDSAGQGLLRLMGLFNFDSLARRLRLDFSDLYKSGLAFDEISGQVNFSQGSLTVTQPVVMQSPSSRMQMTGQVNLLDETLDTRLVATLPVAGNLTVITALAAGLPAAAGVFLISKIFEDEMHKMTSVSYTITGSWDQPMMDFDRLFDADPVTE